MREFISLIPGVRNNQVADKTENFYRSVKNELNTAIIKRNKSTKISNLHPYEINERFIATSSTG